jgi:hypothetical protein
MALYYNKIEIKHTDLAFSRLRNENIHKSMRIPIINETIENYRKDWHELN